jgi:hypothetical protein
MLLIVNFIDIHHSTRGRREDRSIEAVDGRHRRGFGKGVMGRAALLGALISVLLLILAGRNKRKAGDKTQS